MFERSFNFALANGAGPAVDSDNFNLPDRHLDLILEAWISNFGGANVHIFEGRLSAAAAAGQLEAGLNSMIMTVTGSGPCRVALPSDVTEFTVMFEGVNSAGVFQVVTIRVYERGGES